MARAETGTETVVERPTGTPSQLSTHVPSGHWLNGGRLWVAARVLGNKAPRACGNTDSFVVGSIAKNGGKKDRPRGTVHSTVIRML